MPLSSHPYAIAILASFISSLAAVFCRGALYGIPPLWLAACQCWLLVICMGCLTRPATVYKLWRSKDRNLFVLVGSLQAISSVLYTNGAAHTTATNALFLTKVLPYWVLFWEFLLFKTKIKSTECLLLGVHLCGAFLLSTRGDFLQIGVGQFGDLLLISAAMVSALATILSQRLIKTYQVREITLASMVVAGVWFGTALLMVRVPYPNLSPLSHGSLFLKLNAVAFAAMMFLSMFALKSGASHGK